MTFYKQRREGPESDSFGGSQERSLCVLRGCRYTFKESTKTARSSEGGSKPLRQLHRGVSCLPPNGVPMHFKRGLCDEPTSTSICVSISVSIYLHLYLYLSLPTHIHIYIYIYINIRICIYIYAYLCGLGGHRSFGPTAQDPDGATWSQCQLQGFSYGLLVWDISISKAT